MRTLVIAEVASNHGGDLRLAKEFIRAAAEAGADYVKFQSWRAANLRDGRNDPQFEWFQKSELSDKDHSELMQECEKKGVRFLTTVFDVDRVEFLASLGLKEIKVASPDASNWELLSQVKRHFLHILISTGLSTTDEIVETAKYMQGSNFTLFHTVSLYPLPIEHVNMWRLDWLRHHSREIGYSDHTIGIEAAKLAIARGVDYVEKHFCLGRSGPGRVCAWDADPTEMTQIVEHVRLVEKLSRDSGPGLSNQIAESRNFYIGRFGK